ncbi:MAG TPA: hypothetical protein VG838_11210 [Opitutaceae bacterium]|nr:hypothetical protein [Opitutaceae bacterium]
MKSLRFIFAALAAACLISVAAFGADPTGTWKFTMQGGRGGGGGGNGGGAGGAGKGGGRGGAEITLKLELKDGKLTGSVVTPGRQGGEPTTTAITDASFKDDTVSFSVEREFNGNKMVSKYTGKLDGDTITGTVLAPGRGGGEPMPRDWVAKKG